jgi:flagellar protein FliO/FliZ
VVEVRTLDSRRKLILLRRDDCEHLVMLGPHQDLHLEGGIPAPREAAHPVSLAATDAPAPMPAEHTPAKLAAAERRTS